MSTITFDTLRYAERLEQAGVSREQSRAFAEAQRDSLGNAELTTRQDLREMELRLYHQIEVSKSDMIKWIAGLLIAQAALVAALVKLL